VLRVSFSIYLLPPLLSLISGLYLAVLSLARRGGGREKTYFALVCIWYSLVSPVFILHHLIDDPGRILSIERVVHFFYVYLPVVQVAFFHDILDIRRKAMVCVLLGISLLFSLTTLSDWYFHGLYRFNWGYIAKGGIAFQLFGVYCAIILAYCVYCFISRLRVEANPVLRLKYKYMIFSFGLIALLMFMNIPAIQGKNIYPAGNFIFIPMAILAYGVLKHRLLEIGSFLHIALTRLLLCMLIVLPNFYLVYRYAPQVGRLTAASQFSILTAWFCCNYIYIHAVRLLMDRLFYRTRHNLRKSEAGLISEIMILRDTDDLARRLQKTIRTVLPYPWSKVYVLNEERHQLVSSDAAPVALPPALHLNRPKFMHVIEKQTLGMLPQMDDVRAPLLQLMTDLDADCIVPLVHNDTFIGVLGLPEKEDHRPVTPDEAAFLRHISNWLALALSNAVMYQRITALRDSLQVKTSELSQEINDRRRAEQTLRAVQHELQESNLALEEAILQANEMTARLEISNHELMIEMEDRKRADAALRQSEETYRLIAENSTDVIWTTDLQGRFTFVSPSVHHLLGYTPQELKAMAMPAVLTPDSLQAATHAIAEELERVRHPDGIRRKHRSTQLEQVRKDGTTVWTEVNTRFISDNNQNIIGILGVTRDITERKKSEQDLIFMAYFDALTGLYNRKAFIELLEAEIRYAQRYQTGLALLFFDMNKFKLVNDTYGHEIGDKLLKAVGERLKGVIRETDIIARLGGDEFTIILKNPEEISPDIIARRIFRDLAKPFEFEDARIDFVTASIGIASFPKDGQSAGELMKRADLAMYRAKKDSADWLHFDEHMIRSMG